MNAGVLSSPVPESILQDARLLNSDIGRHSVKCNFSTRLAGRFYQNGSLERHTFRTSRLVEMQAKKRRLEKDLQLEEQRVRLLEEKLSDTEKAREDAHGLIITMERGLIQFQRRVRGGQARKLFRRLQHESHMKNLVAHFFQRHHRGRQGRLRAKSRREHLRRKQKQDSATAIQASMRRKTQRKHYLNLLAERDRLNNESAAAIQAILRGNLRRQLYLAEIRRRHDAASSAQRVWRGIEGRRIAEALRQEIIQKRNDAERPKRIPLHMRRYSTYGSGKKAGANGSKKRDPRMRRRSSDAMIIMKDGHLASLANFKSTSSTGHDDPDENDSIATTMTSLTNQTNATGNSSRRRIHNRTNPVPPWRAPQRPGRSVATLQPSNKVNSRRASLERRKTISGLASGHTAAKKLSRMQQHILLQTCAGPGSDSPQRSKSDAPDKKHGSSEKKHGDDRQLEDGAVAKPKKNPSRERISTPITVSEEASLIVQAVLGKTILCHSIVHSEFEDEVSEHEDDLQ